MKDQNWFVIGHLILKNWVSVFKYLHQKGTFYRIETIWIYDWTVPILFSNTVYGQKAEEEQSLWPTCLSSDRSLILYDSLEKWLIWIQARNSSFPPKWIREKRRFVLLQTLRITVGCRFDRCFESQKNLHKKVSITKPQDLTIFCWKQHAKQAKKLFSWTNNRQAKS